jgi:hypothetical protein
LWRSKIGGAGDLRDSNSRNAGVRQMTRRPLWQRSLRERVPRLVVVVVANVIELGKDGEGGVVVWWRG